MRRLALGLVLGLALGSAQAAPPADGWREIPLDAARLERLEREVRRAILARWKKRLRDFDLAFRRPSLWTDGTAARLRADGVSVLARVWRIGDLPVRGRLDFGAVELDYARLGVGQLEVVGETRARVHVQIHRDGLTQLMAKAGFEDIGYEWVPETKEFVLWGYRPIRLLFFRVRPRIKVRLRPFLEGVDIGFRGVRLYISAIPRFIEKIAERRIMAKLGQRITLQKDFDKLARRGLRAAGGVVEILDQDDQVALRAEIPGDPKLAPAQPPVAPPVREGPFSLEP